MSDGSRRSARRLALLVAAALLLPVLLRGLLATPLVGGWLGDEAARQLAARTRSAVQLSSVRFEGILTPCFEDFALHRYHGPVRVRLATRRACVHRWPSAIGSGLRAIEVTLDSPWIELEVVEPTAKPPTAAAQAGPRTGPLRELALVFDDLRLGWRGLPLPARLAAGSFGPIDGRFLVQERAGRRAVVLEVARGATELSGRLSAEPDAWDLAAGVEGDLVTAFGEWLAVDGVRIRRLPTRGRVGARFSPSSNVLDLDLDLEQADIDVESDLVASSRLVGYSARQRARVRLDLAERRFTTKEVRIEVNGVPVELSLDVQKSGDRSRFDLSARLPETGFRDLLLSLPGPGEAERLGPIPSDLTLTATFRLTGFADAPRTWVPRVERRFARLPGGPTGLERFDGPFPYHPLGPEGRAEAPVLRGPETPGWWGYDAIPYLLRRAIVVSEDASFNLHDGLDLDELRAVVEDALDGASRPRGGSTITQQLVKNLFLSRERSALRKVQEVLLTWWLEDALDKRRIFELYANLVEWAPGVYGIHDAAHHYFGTPPDRLDPLEIAFLASSIPAPSRAAAYRSRGSVPRTHRARMDQLLDRLHRLGHLDDDRHAAARARTLRFSPRAASALPGSPERATPPP